MKIVILICLVVGICCRSLGQQLQDAGIAKVVESQRWGVSIPVPAGTSAAEALKVFAIEHGMGEKLSADMVWTVGTAGFHRKRTRRDSSHGVRRLMTARPIKLLQSSRRRFLCRHLMMVRAKRLRLAHRLSFYRQRA